MTRMIPVKVPLTNGNVDGLIIVETEIAETPRNPETTLIQICPIHKMSFRYKTIQEQLGPTCGVE